MLLFALVPFTLQSTIFMCLSWYKKQSKRMSTWNASTLIFQLYNTYDTDPLSTCKKYEKWTCIKAFNRHVKNNTSKKYDMKCGNFSTQNFKSIKCLTRHFFWVDQSIIITSIVKKILKNICSVLGYLDFRKHLSLIFI